MAGVNVVISQDICSSVLFRAKNVLAKPLVNTMDTMDPQLNQVLADFNVISVLQARPDGKTQNVRDIYEIKLLDNQNIDNLFNTKGNIKIKNIFILILYISRLILF